MEKLYTLKTFLKMSDGRIHSLPLILPPLDISYRNHQKGLAYFSDLAPLVLFFFTKRQGQKGGGMAQGPPKYAPARHTNLSSFMNA